MEMHMEFTNKAGLPKALANFLKYNDYNRSGARFDISATKLIDSPQVAALWKEHSKEVVEDVSDRLWSAVGSGIHSRLEVANASDPDIIMEKRFIAEIGGKMVSAQIDVLDIPNQTLIDLKTTSAWKVVNKDFDKYEAQLNIQAHLAHMHLWEIRKIQACVICRDWSKVRSSEPNYPNTPIQIIDLPLWSLEQQRQYILDRLEVHFGEGEKVCTDEERWAKPASFAVMKKGRKSALRVLPTEAKALSWVASQGHTGKDISIVERPATYTRCESYCAVSKWCQQHNQEQSK
jgi:hypothetical protein